MEWSDDDHISDAPDTPPAGRRLPESQVRRLLSLHPPAIRRRNGSKRRRGSRSAALVSLSAS